MMWFRGHRLTLSLSMLLALGVTLLLPAFIYFAVRPAVVEHYLASERQHSETLARYLIAIPPLKHLNLPVQSDWIAVHGADLRKLANQLGLQQVQLTDADGRSLFSSDPFHRPASNRVAHLPIGGRFNRAYLDIYAPISARIGSLNLWFGLASAIGGLVCAGLSFYALGVTRRQREVDMALDGGQPLHLALLKAAPFPVFVTDDNGRVRVCNDGFQSFVGRSRAQIIGRSIVDVAPQELAEAFMKVDSALLDSGGVQSCGATLKAATGEVKQVVFHKVAYRGAVGGAGMIGVLSDQTERKQADDEIRRLAYYDSLTGLPNRSLFIDRLQEALDDAEAGVDQLALMMVDIDNFKQINDQLGHKAGDRLLADVTAVIVELTQDEDTIGRLGGDEFGLILGGKNSVQRAGRLADNLVNRLERKFSFNDQHVYVTVSVGISMFPLDSLEGTTLLRHAELALFEAKRKGRNRYRFYTSRIHREVRGRRTLETGLRQAMENNEFQLAYQPQVTPENGQIVGVEALVRWFDPQRGLVPPSEFIPVAEETGLIGSLGAWILREACQQAASWQQLGYAPITLSVNISRDQFDDANFVDHLDRVLEETGLPPHLLELELTESLFMENATKNITNLIDFKTRGMPLIIDDFGTGYSSLSYLKNLPVDGIKIDRSFVEDIGQKLSNTTIVDAILALAQSLNLGVTVEGVETQAQLDYFRQVEGVRIQGYYYHPALPPQQLLPRLTKASSASAPLRRIK